LKRQTQLLPWQPSMRPKCFQCLNKKKKLL
jgi:hypothetical protein